MDNIPIPSESGIRLSPVYAVRVSGSVVATYDDLLDAIDRSKWLGVGAEVVRTHDGEMMQRTVANPLREVFSHREAERRERRMSMQTVARLLRSAS